MTGHRKLASVPALTTAIDRALDLIMSQLRPAVRAHCRLVAVSALADGADRLVADRVLARPGARLEVILPMPRAEYVTDFKNADSLAEFEGLLRHASWVGTIPPNRTREDAYAEAGRAVTDRADVAIAVWDGASRRRKRWHRRHRDIFAPPASSMDLALRGRSTDDSRKPGKTDRWWLARPDGC